MADFSVQLDTSEVDEFNRAMPREIFNATRSAIRTTTTFTKKELAKRMADATEIPIKAFKIERIFDKSYSDTELSKKIWFGFKPIKARFAGEMYENPDGAVAGSYFFRKAFIASINGGAENIFKRGGYYINSKGKRRQSLVGQYAELPEAIEITAEVASLSEQELLTRFSKKLNAYIEKRESAA